MLERFSRPTKLPATALAPNAQEQLEPAADARGREGVVMPTDPTPTAMREALEAAAVRVAVEYVPTAPSELPDFSALIANGASQQALVVLTKTLSQKTPTLYVAELPPGAELVKAVGKPGFRGFSRTGGTTAQAVLKPIPGGALAAASMIAVGGAALAAGTVFRRRQSARQSDEEARYVGRLNRQQAIDAELSLAISLLLDGRAPQVQHVLTKATDEFNVSKLFLDRASGGADAPGSGSNPTAQGSFVRELHLSRTAIEIKRKALVAHAACLVLDDPSNPFAATQKFLNAEMH